MSHEVAQEIIRKAREDRAVYEEMAARETAVWSRILPALEVSSERAADAAASVILGVTRQTSSFVREARTRGLHFACGLTLGCGAGRLERQIMDHGLCDSFHGIDIAEAAIEDARRQAAEKGTRSPIRPATSTTSSCLRRRTI